MIQEVSVQELTVQDLSVQGVSVREKNGKQQGFGGPGLLS